MNDRILGALQGAGVKEAPIASLDHEQQFFALTPQALFYQAADQSTPMQQVTLREISRIHSDHQGTLRVEASSGNGVTASLLGFDPNRVQRFFQTVRDTTARAKQQPSSPLPSAGNKAFGTAPGAGSAPATAGPATPADQASPSAPPASTSPLSAPAADAPASGPRIIKIGEPQPAAPKPGPPRIEGQSAISVTASSTLNSPTSSGPSLTSPSLSGPKLSKAEPERPADPPNWAQHPAKSAAAKPEVQPPSLSDQAADPSATPTLEGTLDTARLSRSAQTVGGLSLTVRVLAVVLVLGALGMGYFLWQQGKGSQIPALWTVSMGVVTSVALLVLAEVLKLLSALGHAVAGSGSPRA